MPAAGKRLHTVVASLAKLYGALAEPETTNAFELVLLENLAYLASDARRAEAWRAFRRDIGTRPEHVLAASPAAVREIARAGILPAGSAAKIREAARIALEDFGGDLDAALDAAPERARAALKRFPGIGDPGAEKILLFSRRERVLALDSNGLRVLLRLGFGREEKSYGASYRSAREATRPQWRADFDWLMRAHRLLRRHGQELCTRSHPLCERCPLTKDCAYFRSLSVGA